MKTNRYPSFSGLRPSSRASSNAKRANRSTDTKPELALRQALRALGVRFRRHSKTVPGNPDLVFRSARVAVFCDGDFWHGRHWSKLKPLLRRRANADYWVAKIAANRRRDAIITRTLTESGWQVLRFWEGDVRRNASLVAARIQHELRRRAVLKESQSGAPVSAPAESRPQKSRRL
jgi:DNA mismatch endonuclease (patch repair protein)